MMPPTITLIPIISLLLQTRAINIISSSMRIEYVGLAWKETTSNYLKLNVRSATQYHFFALQFVIILNFFVYLISSEKVAAACVIYTVCCGRNL